MSLPTSDLPTSDVPTSAVLDDMRASIKREAEEVTSTHSTDYENLVLRHAQWFPPEPSSPSYNFDWALDQVKVAWAWVWAFVLHNWYLDVGGAGFSESVVTWARMAQGTFLILGVEIGCITRHGLVIAGYLFLAILWIRVVWVLLKNMDEEERANLLRWQIGIGLIAIFVLLGAFELLTNLTAAAPTAVPPTAALPTAAHPTTALVIDPPRTTQ